MLFTPPEKVLWDYYGIKMLKNVKQHYDIYMIIVSENLGCEAL